MTVDEHVIYAEVPDGDGGIRFRLDLMVEINGSERWISYTTNREGQGLFYHNGLGGRDQIRGTGQFSARSLRQFRARTAAIVRGFSERGWRP